MTDRKEIAPSSPPAIAEPAARPTVPQPKRRPVPRKVHQAIELIVTGQVKTQKQAAKRVGLARETLSRYFARVECQEAMRSRAGREVAIGAGRGAARLIQLIDSTSQKVSLDASKYALGSAGIKPSSDAVSVNVGVQLAGWVIDLSEKGAPMRVVGGEAKTIDAEPVRGIGPDRREPQP